LFLVSTRPPVTHELVGGREGAGPKMDSRLKEGMADALEVKPSVPPSPGLSRSPYERGDQPAVCGPKRERAWADPDQRRVRTAAIRLHQGQRQHLEQATGVLFGVGRPRDVGPGKHRIHVQPLTSCLHQLSQRLVGRVAPTVFVS